MSVEIELKDPWDFDPLISLFPLLGAYHFYVASGAGAVTEEKGKRTFLVLANHYMPSEIFYMIVSVYTIPIPIVVLSIQRGCT